MTITVLPILEPELIPSAPLSKVMNERLRNFAKELRDVHLHNLSVMEPLYDDIVIYISYGNNYSIRWKIVNDVEWGIETIVANQCAKLGYVKWKITTINTFKGQ